MLDVYGKSVYEKKVLYHWCQVEVTDPAFHDSMTGCGIPVGIPWTNTLGGVFLEIWEEGVIVVYL